MNFWPNQCSIFKRQIDFISEWKTIENVNEKENIKRTGSMTPANGTALASLAPDAAIFSSCFRTGSIDVHSCFIVCISNFCAASRIVAPALCGFGAGAVSSTFFASFLSPFGDFSPSFTSKSLRLTADGSGRSVVSSVAAAGVDRADDFGARRPPAFDIFVASFSHNHFIFLTFVSINFEFLVCFGLKFQITSFLVHFFSSFFDVFSSLLQNSFIDFEYFGNAF